MPGDWCRGPGEVIWTVRLALSGRPGTRGESGRN